MSDSAALLLVSAYPSSSRHSRLLQIGFEADADVGLDYAKCKEAVDTVSKELRKAAQAKEHAARQAGGVAR